MQATKRPALTTALAMAMVLVTCAAWAGSISGTVTILGKDGRPLARSDNAVVYLQGIETSAPDAPAVLDQVNKEFVPRLLPVIKGQEIRFPNSDPLQHNVFSPHEQEPFDLGLYSAGESRSVRLNVLGRHKVYCNLHKSMVADILVLPNRYFGLTDARGHYRIDTPPAGEFVVRVWHVFGGSDQRAIRVGSTDTTADFTVRSPQGVEDVMEHPDKAGKDYVRPSASPSSPTGY
jgi:plastocyanin